MGSLFKSPSNEKSSPSSSFTRAVGEGGFPWGGVSPRLPVQAAG